MEKLAGLFGLFGLVGLIGLVKPVPFSAPGGLLRLASILGFIGWAGFWYPLAGAIGAIGAFGVWNHPNPKFARLAYLGFTMPIGVAMYFVGRYG